MLKYVAIKNAGLKQFGDRRFEVQPGQSGLNSWNGKKFPIVFSFPLLLIFTFVIETLAYIRTLVLVHEFQGLLVCKNRHN